MIRDDSLCAQEINNSEGEENKKVLDEIDIVQHKI